MTNKTTYQAFLRKLTKETVFFKNEFEQAFIKSVPGEGYTVKFPGQKEFKADPKSQVVADAILEFNEITEKEYKAA